MMNQAVGDDIPLHTNILVNPQEDAVPMKTRLPESEIQQFYQPVQQIAQQQNQQEQIPQQQHRVLFERQEQYNQIILKKNNSQKNQNKQDQDQNSLSNMDDIKAEKILIVAPTKPYSREPQLLHCEKCNKTKLSKVELKAGWGSCLLATLFCLSPLIIVFFLPCCMRQCKDAHHYCQNCAEKLGTYNFICD